MSSMANQKQYALGIDLGGTKTLAAVVDVTTGEVIASERKRTHAEKGQEYISQHITDLSTAALESAKLPNGAKIAAVGIGAAGQIDRKKGVVVDAPNLSRSRPKNQDYQSKAGGFFGCRGRRLPWSTGSWIALSAPGCNGCSRLTRTDVFR